MTRRQFAKGLAGVAGGAALGCPRRAAGEKTPIRIALSTETLTGANIADARAAYHVWTDEVVRRFNVERAQVVDQVFLAPEEMLRRIRAGQVDCFALSAWEYASVINLIDPSEVLVKDYEVKGIDYLVLVHNDSAYRKLEDLKGVKLLMHHHCDTSVLRIWLSLLLANAGRPAPDQFFDAVELHPQIMEVILPVFFRKAEAAAISRHAFNMAVELNPQLGRELRPVAVSQPVIPAGFWFRKDGDEQGIRAVEQSLLQLSAIPAGRQILTLYQTASFVRCPCSVMESTLGMIREYERIRKRSAEAE